MHCTNKMLDKQLYHMIILTLVRAVAEAQVADWHILDEPNWIGSTSQGNVHGIDGTTEKQHRHDLEDAEENFI